MKTPRKSEGGCFVRRDGKLIRYTPPTHVPGTPRRAPFEREAPTAAPPAESTTTSAGGKRRRSRKTRKHCQE